MSSRPSLIKVGRGQLSYQSPDDQWHYIDALPGQNPAYNVTKIRFEFRVEFSQSTKDAVCTAKYIPGQYSKPIIHNVGKRFEIRFQDALPECEFNGENPDKARDFPLARIPADAKAVKIEMRSNEMEGAGDGFKEIKANLDHLTSGDITRNPEFTEGEFVQTTLDISSRESAAQTAMTVVVMIWPSSNPDEMQLQAGTHQYGSRYKIISSTVFPGSELAAHKVVGGEDNGWEMTVADYIPETQHAPLVGIVRNSFKGDLDDYVGRIEDDVKLEPIYDDVLGDSSRKALFAWADEMNDFAANAAGFFHRDARKESIPMKAMFIKSVPYNGGENKLPGVRPQMSAMWTTRLNQSQTSAVQMAFEHKLSLIWGPAATGKTETLAMLFAEILISDPKEKVLFTSPRHVAVDTICKRCIEVWRHGSKDQPFFVRLFSMSQIIAQQASGSIALRNPYHIHNLRMEVAKGSRPNYDGFLIGWKDIVENGGFEDDKKAGAFNRARNALDRMIMDRARAVFCTTAATRSGALIWKETVGKEVVTKTWDPTTNMVDEAACANPLEILLPLATFKSIRRVVLGGDHLQLPLYLVSKGALAAWHKTLFEEIKIKGFPCTMLNLQYRTHDDLAEASQQINYPGLEAFFKTSSPRPFLQKLLEKLPVTFTTRGQQYSLTSYVNFVDIANGHERTDGKGSSLENVEEVEAIVDIVKRFLGLGMSPFAIGVVTGYRRQFDVLKEHFQEIGKSIPEFQQVRILTANTIRGAEFDIVILTLVKTAGGRGFVGERRRANVITTRGKEANYYVGNWSFWASKNSSGLNFLDKTLYRIRDTCGTKSLTGQRPDFIVRANAGTPSVPVATPTAPLALRSPASAPTPVPAPTRAASEPKEAEEAEEAEDRRRQLDKIQAAEAKSIAEIEKDIEEEREHGLDELRRAYEEKVKDTVAGFETAREERVKNAAAEFQAQRLGVKLLRWMTDDEFSRPSGPTICWLSTKERLQTAPKRLLIRLLSTLL